MRMPLRSLTPVLLLSALPLAAQSYLVSPAAYTSTQGNSTNPLGFSSAQARYQQIHGDLRGMPRVFTGMSLRRGATANTTATARTLDLTVTLADSRLRQVTPTFAANYASSPMTVLPKMSVNFPDWTVSGGSPEPWTVVVPFTVPYVYLGQIDLLWEWAVENNTGATQNYSADAYSGLLLGDLTQATHTTLGVGCTATSQMNPLNFGPRAYTSAGLDAFYYKGTALNGPPNVPAAILFGLSNPNLTFPGLCTTVHTDGLISFSSMTSAAGSWSMPDLLLRWDPAWQGLKIYAQGVCTDFGQPGLPLALTNGVETVVPGMGSAPPAQIIRIFNTTSSTATTGTVNYYSYGLIVRFTHA